MCIRNCYRRRRLSPPGRLQREVNMSNAEKTTKAETIDIIIIGIMGVALGQAGYLRKVTDSEALRNPTIGGKNDTALRLIPPLDALNIIRGMPLWVALGCITLGGMVALVWRVSKGSYSDSTAVAVLVLASLAPLALQLPTGLTYILNRWWFVSRHVQQRRVPAVQSSNDHVSHEDQDPCRSKGVCLFLLNTLFLLQNGDVVQGALTMGAGLCEAMSYNASRVWITPSITPRERFEALIVLLLVDVCLGVPGLLIMAVFALAEVVELFVPSVAISLAFNSMADPNAERSLHTLERRLQPRDDDAGNARWLSRWLYLANEPPLMMIQAPYACVPRGPSERQPIINGWDGPPCCGCTLSHGEDIRSFGGYGGGEKLFLKQEERIK